MSLLSLFSCYSSAFSSSDTFHQQQISWIVRTGISYATVTISINQYTAEATPSSDPKSKSPENSDAAKYTHIIIDQTITGGIKGSTERRCLDWSMREHVDGTFGKLKGRSRWVALEDLKVSEMGEGAWDGMSKFLLIFRFVKNSFLKETKQLSPVWRWGLDLLKAATTFHLTSPVRTVDHARPLHFQLSISYWKGIGSSLGMDYTLFQHFC